VGVVGDSITNRSVTSIRSDVEGVHLEIEALNGHTVRAMTPYVESDIMKGPGGPPHSIFINLGTNDIIHGNPQWESNWNTLMKDTASVPCTVLFTISTVVDAYGHHPPGPTSQDFNRVIENAHKADPSRVHVIDWNAAVHADFGLIELDGVHPTSKGEAWIGRHIASTLKDVCHE
jgi:lysophospholipase L1-like esterase